MSRTLLCFVSVEILPVESKDSGSVVTIDLVSDDDDDHNDIPLKKPRQKIDKNSTPSTRRLKKRQFLTFFREKRPASLETDSEERENLPTHDQGI